MRICHLKSDDDTVTPCRLPQIQSQKRDCFDSLQSAGLCRDSIDFLDLPLETSVSKKLRGVGSVEYYNGKRNHGKGRHIVYSYLKPGELAQIRDAQKSVRASLGTTVGKKRSAVGESASEDVTSGGAEIAIAGSPERVAIASAPRSYGPSCLQRKKLLAPKMFVDVPKASTSTSTSAAEPNRLEATTTGAESSSAAAATTTATITTSAAAEEEEDEECAAADVLRSSSPSSSSSLECLPLELLVRIVCRLNHNELKPVFHINKSFRQAVMIAKQCHFNFTTPCREYRPFSGLNHVHSFFRLAETPNAPKHAPKPTRPRISMAEMKQIAATLFQNTSTATSSTASTTTTADYHQHHHQQHQHHNHNQHHNHHHHQHHHHHPHPHHQTLRATGASHRVLFNEEELCQAIAQNTL